MSNTLEDPLNLLIAHPDDADDLPTLFAQAEEAAAAGEVIKHLSNEDREILELAAQGLIHTQIGEQLNITPAAARKRLERARHRARRQMETE